MDLSKLPRLSETDKQMPPPISQQEQPQGQPLSFAPREVHTGSGAEVWFSAILGLVFMMMGWTFARFLFAKITGQTFHTGVLWTLGEKEGQEVAYFELQGYTAYTETAVFLFGLAMVLEAGILAFARRNTPASRAAVTLALALTAGMTLFNLVVAGMLFNAGITPLTSILAIAFGGWMAMHQWQLLKQMLAAQRA